MTKALQEEIKRMMQEERWRPELMVAYWKAKGMTVGLDRTHRSLVMDWPAREQNIRCSLQTVVSVSTSWQKKTPTWERPGESRVYSRSSIDGSASSHCRRTSPLWRF
ncbi:MAG: hypothetical protein OXC92_00645 [Flavobacteriaceae bacterium]|nr:hypothetical protein [Flavobacteriaceae bacterium]